MLTLEQFQVATGSTLANASVYYTHACAAMERFDIATSDQVAAFCATIGVETQRLTKMQEDLYYTHPERLVMVFRRVFDLNKDGRAEPEEIEACTPYCRNPRALSQKLYGGFHGRGGTMLTWERNYALHGLKLGFDYVNNPDLLLTPQHAMLSAGSFWDEGRINAVAHNMDEVTLRVNGPARLALAERIALRDEGLKVLA